MKAKHATRKLTYAGLTSCGGLLTLQAGSGESFRTIDIKGTKDLLGLVTMALGTYNILVTSKDELTVIHAETLKRLLESHGESYEE